jgi:hypothetical protein
MDITKSAHSVIHKIKYYQSCSLVIALVVHFLGHAEIGHFGHSVVGQQNISGGQITMEDL